MRLIVITTCSFLLASVAVNGAEMETKARSARERALAGTVLAQATQTAQPGQTTQTGQTAQPDQTAQSSQTAQGGQTTQTGQTAQAAQAAQAAPPPSAALNAAVALYNKKKHREALTALIQVTKSEPRNSSAFYYLANCYYLLGDASTATKLFEYLTKAFPKTQASTYAAEFLKTHPALQGGAEGASPGAAAATARTATASTSSKPGDKTASARDFAAAPQSISSLLQVVRPRKDRPAVSDSTVMALRKSLDGLPDSVKAVLWNTGIKFYVAPTVEDYEPGAKYQEGRGYEGNTLKSCPAFYCDRKVVIAEHTLDEGDESLKDKFPASEMVNSLYHETGHALDHALNDLSSSDEFKHAYLLDSARIDPATANTLKYYLQKSEAGQEECCAELIGTLLGRSKDTTEAMRSSFPLTLKFLRAKLGL